MLLRIVLALMLVFMLSCSKDKPEPADTPDATATVKAKATPAKRSKKKTGPSKQEGPLPDGAFILTEGKRTLVLNPAIAYINTKMSLRANGFEIPQSAGDDRIIWYVNGSGVSSDDPGSLDMTTLVSMKGDLIQAGAVIGGEEIYSNYVVLSNYPPKFATYELKVDINNLDGGLYIDATVEDIDGDPVSIEYEWYVNGTPAGNDRAPSLKVLPGDEIKCIIKTHDGTEYGETRQFKRTLLGQSPQFQSIEEYFMVGNTYIYNAVAGDPDGETVIFSLQDAPAGMTVNGDSGQVKWDVPADYLGTINYVIIASDAAGNEARLPMNFTVYNE